MPARRSPTLSDLKRIEGAFSKLYYNIESALAYTNQPRLLSKAAKGDLDSEIKNFATIARASEWLRKQKLYQSTKTVRKKYARVPFFSPNVDHLWIADCAYLPEFKKASNGYDKLLAVLDVFSRYAYCRLTKSLKSSEISQHFESIIETSGRKPTELISDRGSEFIGAAFKSLLEKHNIRHSFSTDPVFKTSIPERYFRTIKSHVHRHSNATGETDLRIFIQKLVQNYNSRKHRSIGMSPKQARISENYAKVYDKLYTERFAKTKQQAWRFDVGSEVRISKLSQFGKMYKPEHWTDEKFKIVRRKNTRPVMYVLADVVGRILEGSFYESEIVFVPSDTELPPMMAGKVVKNIIDRVLRTRKNKQTGGLEHLVRWKSPLKSKHDE